MHHPGRRSSQANVRFTIALFNMQTLRLYSIRDILSYIVRPKIRFVPPHRSALHRFTNKPVSNLTSPCTHPPCNLHPSPLTADVEDITAKTGNFKKFPVFVKMLASAVRRQSESVFIDLLTYQDLELLKSKKAGGPDDGHAKVAVVNNTKRYLILTYAAEFDRVHYPLPLMYEDNPDPNRLKAIIKGLREQASSTTSSDARRGQQESGELKRMRDENASLRQQLLQASSVTVPPPRPLQAHCTRAKWAIARHHDAYLAAVGKFIFQITMLSAACPMQYRSRCFLI